MTEQTRPLPEVGDRVHTPDGPGDVVGWHTSQTWVFGRLERRSYAIVELDDTGRRLYRPEVVTATMRRPPAS